MRILFLVALLSCGCVVKAQQNGVEQLKSVLADINDQKQAEKFLKKNKGLKGNIITIDPKHDSSATAKNILTKKSGEIIVSSASNAGTTQLLKILTAETITAYRVQYIFLDGSKLSMSKIESLRKLILKRLESGEPFDQLAREYSMDQSAAKGGDLGWFEANQMVSEFSTAVKSNDFGKVFTVDVPDQKWYYVVKNSHKPREDNVVTAIFIETKE